MIDALFNTTLVLILLVIASIIVYILCKYQLIPVIKFEFDFVKRQMHSQSDRCTNDYNQRIDCNIFIAGSTKLRNEHARIGMVIKHLRRHYRQYNIHIDDYNYDDSVFCDQRDYNQLISEKNTRFIIFILDREKEGAGITPLEFDLACNEAKQNINDNGKHDIILFNKKYEYYIHNKDVEYIEMSFNRYFNNYRYWISYKDLDDLEKECAIKLRSMISYIYRHQIAEYNKSYLKARVF